MIPESVPVLRPGEKVHLMSRRLFDGDLRRHFAGEVVAVEGGIARLVGYAFVFYPDRNEFVRRPDVRTRVVGLGAPQQVLNVLPEDVDVGALRYAYVERRLMVVDGHGFSLDVNEFGATN